MNARQLIGTVLDTVLKIVVIVAVAMFTFKYASEAYNFGYAVFSDQPIATEETAKTISISITEEAKVKDIAQVLEEKGLINDAGLFVVQEMLSGYHGEMKPGTYELSSNMTASQMLSAMSAAEAPDTEGMDAEGSIDNTDMVGEETAEEILSDRMEKDQKETGVE